MAKILLIEDDRHVRVSIKEILNDEGHQVYTAENGYVGIETAREVYPDLIICDIIMPGISGFEVIQRIQHESNLSFIPFIFLSAKNAKTDFRKGMELGADDYLTKPFSAEDLITAINVRLDKDQKREERTETHISKLTRSISFALPHELRTPLTTILGYSEILINEVRSMSMGEISELAKYINDSAEKLKLRVEKVLLYSKLQFIIADKNQISDYKKSRYELTRNHVEAVIHDYFSESSRFGDITIECEDTAVCVEENFLNIILTELIDNSIKFSQKNTPISVRGVDDGDHYILTFADCGKGIDKDKVKHIGAFYQFDRDINDHEGLGLGLEIVSKVCRIFDIKLEFESEGGGTEVILTFKK